jgi:hypothetical protein
MLSCCAANAPRCDFARCVEIHLRSMMEIGGVDCTRRWLRNWVRKHVSSGVKWFRC